MSSRQLSDCEPELAARFLAGREAYELDHPGHRLEVTCTARSVEEQTSLFHLGRRFWDGHWVLTDPFKVVTYCDGVTNKSEHNHEPSRAIDFAIVINGKTVWADAFYDEAGPYFQRAGLIWGGAFPHAPNFHDRPHVELPP
jgi:D-alanyl-D-alanine carboxypeptidase